MQVLCDTLLVHLYFAYVFCMHVFWDKLLLHYSLCMYFAIHYMCIPILHMYILPNKKIKKHMYFAYIYFAYMYFAIHQQCIGAQVHIPRPTICASCLLSAQPPLTEHII